MAAIHAATFAACATEENAPVVVPSEAFAEQFAPGKTGLGSPLLVLPAQGKWLALRPAAKPGPTDAGWSDQQSLTLSGDHELLVQRTRSFGDHRSDQELVERLVLTPRRPWTAELEIRYPFRIDFLEDGVSAGHEQPAAGGQGVSLVLPLRNGWARRWELGGEPVTGEYRLADTLTGIETSELALPVIQIDGPGNRQAAVMADPRFSALFIVRQSGQAVEGEIRYRFRGDRVPLQHAEQRWVGICALRPRNRRARSAPRSTRFSV